MTSYVFAEALFSHLPLSLLLVPEGKRMAIQNIGVPWAVCETDEPQAFFDAYGFCVGGDWYEYGSLYSIDDKPQLQAWLKKQQIQVVGYGQTIISS